MSVTILFVQNGYNLKTRATLVSLAVVTVFIFFLALLVAHGAKISGYNELNMYEDETAMLAGHVSINMTAAAVAMVIVGIVGAVIDVAIAVSSAVYEVKCKNPELTERELLGIRFPDGRKYFRNYGKYTPVCGAWRIASYVSGNERAALHVWTVIKFQGIFPDAVSGDDECDRMCLHCPGCGMDHGEFCEKISVTDKTEESMQKEEREQELAYFDQTEQKIKEQVKALRTVIEEGNKKIKEQKQFVWDNTADMDEEELLENKNSLEQDVLLLEFYGKNLAALERLEQTPYFGKVGFTYEENGEHLPVYIGVNGFRPKERKLPLVYDWRAPISSLYYAYEKGPAKYQAPEGTFQGVIDEKKQFQIREGKMQYMLDTDLRIDDDVLQRELGENHGSKMKQIAATIQKEQNEIIRNAAEETLVIDGCAGSGKTVIALHRIAWLLYNHRERLNTQNVMILSPNAFFSDYIAEVLPELGEDNCIEKEFDDLLADMLFVEDPYEFKGDQIHAVLDAKNMEAERVQRIRYKSSISYFKRLDAYLKQRPKISMGEERPLHVYLRFLRELEKELPQMAVYQNDRKEICYEDILAVFYIQVRCFGGSFPQIRHLVIDEMQDYNVFQFAILKRLFACPKTILGDKNQVLLSEKPTFLGYMLSHVFPEAKLLSLTKSYRSTKEITEFCSHIIGDTGIVPFEREGKEPVVKKERSRAAVLSDVQNAVAELDMTKYRTAAVLCRNEEEALFVYDSLKKDLPVTLIKETTTVYCEGILVMPAYFAKGLEFDAVVVCDMGREAENPITRQEFYIACTRALHELFVFHKGSFDAYLK